MFPIPWNEAYRKKDGTLVNIDDAIDGGSGSSDIPEYSAEDAGKVLAVTEEGTLAWSDVSVSTGGHYIREKSNAPALDIPIPTVKEGE